MGLSSVYSCHFFLISSAFVRSIPFLPFIAEQCSGWPLEIDNDQLRATTEADPLTTTQGVAEERNINHSMVIQHLKQTEKVKNLSEWVPHEWTTKQKKHHFEVSLLLFHATTIS